VGGGEKERGNLLTILNGRGGERKKTVVQGTGKKKVKIKKAILTDLGGEKTSKSKKGKAQRHPLFKYQNQNCPP